MVKVLAIIDRHQGGSDELRRTRIRLLCALGGGRGGQYPSPMPLDRSMALVLEGVRWLFFDLGYTLINEDAAAMGRLSQASDALRQRGINVSTR